MKAVLFLLFFCFAFLAFSSLTLAFSLGDFWNMMYSFFVPSAGGPPPAPESQVAITGRGGGGGGGVRPVNVLCCSGCSASSSTYCKSSCPQCYTTTTTTQTPTTTTTVRMCPEYMITYCPTGKLIDQGTDENGCKLPPTCCGDSYCSGKENVATCAEDCSCGEWGVQVVGFNMPGSIPAGSKIQVVYKPTTTMYLKSGLKITAPNDYFALSYNGFNTDKFATINVKPVVGISAYDINDPSKSLGGLNGIEISTDTMDSIRDSTTGVIGNKFYILFDRKTSGGKYPVITGSYDSSISKIIYNYTKSLNFDELFEYTFDFKYGNSGAVDYNLYLFLKPSELSSDCCGMRFNVGRYGIWDLNFAYKSKTNWTSTGNPEFKLGNLAAMSETSEVSARTSRTFYNVGTAKSDVVTDFGIILKSQNSYGQSDQVAFKIPDKELKNNIEFAAGTSSTNTVGMFEECRCLDMLPNGGLFTNTDVSGLLKSTFSYKSSNYDYHEQVDVSGVSMMNDYGMTNVNGTGTMMIENNDIKYEYVFDKEVDLGGTISSPNYDSPVKIKILGQDFLIIGTSMTSIKVLQGKACSAVTATNPCVYNNYLIYATQGSSSWVSVAVKDYQGYSYGSYLISGLSPGAAVSKDVWSLFTITVTKVNALQDGTVIGADMVVGPIGKTEHEYDTSADVTSTGTAGDCLPKVDSCFNMCEKQNSKFGICRTYSIYPGSNIGCGAGETNIGQTSDCKVPSGWAGTDKSCCCSNKLPCPFDCCQNEAKYFDKSCPQISCSRTCAPGQACISCASSWYECVKRTCIGREYKTFNINLHKGWNLFSMPVKQAGIYTVYTTTEIVNAIQSKTESQIDNVTIKPLIITPPYNYCKIVGKVWHYENGQYVEAKQMEPGKGYWIRVDNDCGLSISGYSISIEDFPDMYAEWNQIGSLPTETRFLDMLGNCEIVSGPWKYGTSGYEKIDTMNPGEGYWIKTSEACNMALTLPPLPE